LEPFKRNSFLIHRKNYWQGKTFGNSNIKYLSQGIKPLTIYGKGDTIILVEDVLSAIKIARLRYQGYCSSPLLGSSLSEKSRDILRKNFKNIYIWLDRDKANQAIDIRNNLKSFGINSKVIITKLDPKEYNKEEITNWLKN
jgi:DNA primase